MGSSSSAPMRRSARRRGAARSTTARRGSREAPTIVTDGDRVLQMITNLLSNAFRWTPDGGTVELGSRAATNGASRSTSPTPARASARRSRSASSVPFISRDDRGTGSGSRSRASSRMRSAAASSSTPRSARGAVRAGAAGRDGRSQPVASAVRASADAGVTVRRCPRRKPSRQPLARAAERSRSALVALRPRQWPKNLLLFAGSSSRPSSAMRRAGPRRRGLRRLLRRLERRLSRQRPARCRGRPAAPGQARPADRPRRAAAADGARARGRARRSSRSAIAAALGFGSLACLLAFVALQAAYSLGLKHVVLVDVAVIARAVRDPRGGGCGRGRRADLAVAARLHRAARALPRARQAARPSSSLVGAERDARAGRARGLLALARRPAARRASPARPSSRTRPTRSRRAVVARRSSSRFRSSSSGSSATCSSLHRHDARRGAGERAARRSADPAHRRLPGPSPAA